MRYLMILTIVLLVLAISGCEGWIEYSAYNECENGLYDAENDETGTDCGGENCAPCEAGQNCVESEDCESNYCADYVCAEASCEDGILNGDEDDIDCGGSCEACPQVNLQVYNIDPTSWDADTLTLVISYLNNGDTSTDSQFTNEIIISTLEEQVIATKYSDVSTQIVPDEIISVEETIEVETGLEAGTYYVEIYVDIDDNYDESDEEDNEVLEQITLNEVS